MSSVTQQNPAPTHPSPKIIKKMEKEIAKEGKAEESRVKHTLNDLSSAEKAHTKAEKAVTNAENALQRAEKNELDATNAISKATYDHDISVTNLHSAQQDSQVKKKQEAKLHQDVQAKKDAADAAIKAQNVHNVSIYLSLQVVTSQGEADVPIART
ncbi:hypothetical protein DXG03_004182 [Asterophora parasitica]|uniref:Uncharacterized protein n=1 Tax=Asterophora parasitica TaxID=117018 RepID=A0A9P7G2L4_9AGAR|nr:hypothetical protein DXG03_004182 [Asterophora parasitica]